MVPLLLNKVPTDIDNLERWADKKLIKFSEEKCEIL